MLQVLFFYFFMAVLCGTYLYILLCIVVPTDHFSQCSNLVGILSLKALNKVLLCNHKALKAICLYAVFICS